MVQSTRCPSGLPDLRLSLCSQSLANSACRCHCLPTEPCRSLIWRGAGGSRALWEGHAQLQELGEGGGKVLEEGLLILGILLHIRLELLVPQQPHVGVELDGSGGGGGDAGKLAADSKDRCQTAVLPHQITPHMPAHHHELPALVLVLQRPLPLLLVPLVLRQLHKVEVGEGGGGCRRGGAGRVWVRAGRVEGQGS